MGNALPVPDRGKGSGKGTNMDRDEVTVREACEILGVSRAMVQKLERAGELKGRRDRGRVLFDRGAVEALRTVRDVAKVEREKKAEEAELAQIGAEAEPRDLAFAAWSKTLDEDGERREARETMANIVTELR